MRQFAMLLIVCTCSGCASYVQNRWNDAKDCVTLTYDVGFGAKAQVGPFQAGLHSCVKTSGLRGGDLITDGEILWGYGPLTPFLSENMTFLILSHEEFEPHNQLIYDRGKEYEGGGLLGIGFWDDNCRGPLAPHWTQCEVGVATMLGGVRVGGNPGEILDFIVGFFGIDLYADDVHSVEEERAERKAQERSTREAHINHMYTITRGPERKKWALLKDELDGVNYKRKFGSYYEGKPFNKELAERVVYVSLYRRMYDFRWFQKHLMPESKVPFTVERPLSGVVLGMEDEESAIADAKAFLGHVGEVMEGRRKVVLHEKVAWAYAEIHHNYQRWLKMDNEPEFKSFYPDWLGLEYGSWNLDKEWAGVPMPLETPGIINTWAAYMQRTHGMKPLRQRVLTEVYLQANRIKPLKEQYMDDREKLLKWLANNQDRVEREALAYLTKLKVTFTGGASVPPGTEVLGDDLVAKYVLWQAMLDTKDFAEYARLEQLLRYDTWYTKTYPNKGYTPKAYPKAIAEFKTIKAAYVKSLASAVEDNR